MVIMENKILANKKVLILGIANEKSIAYGCAKMFKKAGADLAITYLNEKAKPFVDKAVNQLDPSIYMRCDVTNDNDIQNVFQQIDSKLGP